MKINSNIPIFAILTLFIASNTLLYQYLNDGYFIDKQPITPEVKVENIIFHLISAHEDVLNKRNAEILLEAERLRNRKLTVTDDTELREIEAKLKALELESLSVLELVQISENEKHAAERKAANNQMQLTELLESNSKMGAQLDSVTQEFEEYVETLQKTLESNSFSEKDLNTIAVAFRNKKGLIYLNDLVGNIQKNRSSLSRSYTEQLSKRSAQYHNGLKNIASLLNNNNYFGTFDDLGLLNTESSIEKLKKTLNNYISTKDRTNLNNLNRELKIQEEEMLLDLENRLKTLSEKEALRLQTALEEQLTKQDELRLSELDLAAKDKELSLIELEKRLREELSNITPVEEVTKTIEVNHALPDKPIYTSWVHIPGIWESTATNLIFSGKKVDTIAWSRNKLQDNEVITFSGDFDKNGECIIILYGNGRFKNWNDGIILTISTLGPGRILLDITKNGLDENSKNLYSNSFNSDNGISGEYYIRISDGILSMSLNGKELVNNYLVDTELLGRIGFGNREINSSKFEISNIKLFNIR